MFAAIESARDHINLETFIIEDDETGRRFADLLLKKRAAGVESICCTTAGAASALPPSSFSACATPGFACWPSIRSTR